MMLIHPPVNPYSPAREIRAWIEILERWETEPVEDPEDLWSIQSSLTNARDWLAEAEARERAAAESPRTRRRA